jgi:hypothetical protein
MSHPQSGPTLARILVVATVAAALAIVGPTAPPFFIADGRSAYDAGEQLAISAAMDDLTIMFKPLQSGWVTVKQVRSVAFDDGCFRVDIRTYGWFGIPHGDWEMTCSGGGLAR